MGGTGMGPTDGTGGVPATDITLLRVSANEKRAGHGGGGGMTTRGGNGGGALFARAEAALIATPNVANMSRLAARGHGGSAQTTFDQAGGGSGGTIYLAAPRIAANLSVDIDLSGGVTAGDISNNDGSPGRLRIDGPETGEFDVTATPSYWRGAGLELPDEISRSRVAMLRAYGGYDAIDGTLGVVSVRSLSLLTGTERVVVEPRPTITGDVDVGLERGVNVVCVDTYRASMPAISEDAAIASNCVEVGYVPQP